MSGSGVGETPNAAFAALSARCLARADGHQGLSSSITESQSYLDRGDDKAFTETLNRRCRALDNQGLSKPDKITLSTVARVGLGSGGRVLSGASLPNQTGPSPGVMWGLQRCDLWSQRPLKQKKHEYGVKL